MPTELTGLRVFIASPSGLTDLRKAFRDEVQEFNEADAVARGVLFQPIGWEDTLGGIGRPQSLINEDVRRADYFVLLLWNRWGTSPDISSSRFSSGTEEEYHVALECLGTERAPMHGLVILFKSVDLEQLTDPGAQLQKVLDFRSTIEQQKLHLFHSFDTEGLFRKIIRRHLAAWLREQEHTGAAPKSAAAQVDPGIDPGQPSPEVSEDSAMNRAWALANEGKLTEAEVEFARIVVERQQPLALVEYGRFLVRLGRVDQATVMFNRAAAIANDHGDQKLLARASRNVGRVLHNRGNLKDAEHMYRKALEIEERLGNTRGRAIGYRNVGSVLRARGDLDGAEQMYRNALEIDEQLGFAPGLAPDYGSLGGVLHDRGELDGAEQMYRKALEITDRLGHLVGTAANYRNLGRLLLDRGELDGAEQVFRKALEISERLGHVAGMATDYGNVGHVLAERGDLDGAKPMYRKALEINERLGQLAALAANYMNLGRLLRESADFKSAEEMLRKALEIDERLGLLAAMATDYESLGRVLHDRGDFDGAEQMQRKALEINARIGANQK